MKVVFETEVVARFEDLSETLFLGEYFSSREAARYYFATLFIDISHRLPQKVRRLASMHFLSMGWGPYMALFRKSRATQWYVFFDLYKENGDDVLLVNHVANNHVVAKYLTP